MAADKDKTIARQSNLKWLLDYCKHINLNLPLADMVRITEALTIYVVDGRTNTVQDMMDKVDKFILEKYDNE